MPDEKELTHDLLRMALNNKCWLAWSASGLLVAGVAGGGVATVILFSASQLGASMTCKPITGDVIRFISESDFAAFHGKVNAYFEISRDEAFALARLATSQGSVGNNCVTPPNIGDEFERLFSISRQQRS